MEKIKGDLRTKTGREYTGTLNNIEAATVEEYLTKLNQEKETCQEFKMSGAGGTVYIKSKDVEVIGVTTLTPKKRPVGLFR